MDAMAISGSEFVNGWADPSSVSINAGARQFQEQLSNVQLKLEAPAETAGVAVRESVASGLDRLVGDHLALPGGQVPDPKAVKHLTNDVAAPGATPAEQFDFNAAMTNLRATYQHAVRAELMSKAASEMGSSVSKLLQG